MTSGLILAGLAFLSLLAWALGFVVMVVLRRSKREDS